jgi:hypothetical protein
VDIDEPCRAFTEGGHVPAGMVFVVRSVEVTARADGSSNGDGSLRLQVGPFRIAGIDRDRTVEREDGLTPYLLKTIDRGRERITNEDFPVTRRFTVYVPIRAGGERDVALEIGNTSSGDVSLRGELLPADEVDPAPDPRETGHKARDFQWYLDSVVASDPWRHLADAFASRNPEARPWLEAILSFGATGEYRGRIEYLLSRMEK